MIYAVDAEVRRQQEVTKMTEDAHLSDKKNYFRFGSLLFLLHALYTHNIRKTT